MGRRVLKEEEGFTLTEVLVTMMLMILVLFALYSIFDMSIRVFSFGNDKVEATENARIGLARMEREVRAAYPKDKAADPADETLFFPGTGANSISFGNDVNGDRIVGTGEEITYTLDGTTLERNTQAAVEFVSDLQFEYQDEQGGTADPSQAEIVAIKLTVSKDGRTQTLSTDVSLRNRNN